MSQEGQESEKVIPDGDSPEASLSRGVVSAIGALDRDLRHTNFFSKRLFCESGGPNNQVWHRMPSLTKNNRLLMLKQGRRSVASTRHCRCRRVKSKGRIRSRPSNTKVSFEGELPAGLRTVQCDHVGTNTGRQSRKKFHQEYRSEVCGHGEGAVARWKGYERTADSEGDSRCLRGAKGK